MFSATNDSRRLLDAPMCLGRGINTLAHSLKSNALRRIKRSDIEVTSAKSLQSFFYIADTIMELQEIFLDHPTISHFVSDQINAHLDSLSNNHFFQLNLAIGMFAIDKFEKLKQVEMLPEAKKILTEPQIEPTKSILEPLQRIQKVSTLEKFFGIYGDSFINSITYGRWGVVVFQFNFKTLREKNIFKEGIFKASQSSENIPFELIFVKKPYKATTITNYTHSHFFPLGDHDLKNFILEFSKEKKDETCSPLNFESLPYHKILTEQAGNVVDNAVQLAIRMAASCELKQLLQKSRRTIQHWLSTYHFKNLPRYLETKEDNADVNEFYFDKDILQFLTDHAAQWGNQVDFLKFLIKLNYEKIRLTALIEDLQIHCLIKRKIIMIARMMSHSYMQPSDFATLPEYLILPFKRLMPHGIQSTTHGKGDYYFSLPSCNSFLFTMNINDERKIFPKINLKQKYIKTYLKKEILRTRTIATLDSKARKCSDFIPAQNQLSELYIKPSKESRAQPFKDVIDFYMKVEPATIPIVFFPSTRYLKSEFLINLLYDTYDILPMCPNWPSFDPFTDEYYVKYHNEIYENKSKEYLLRLKRFVTDFSLTLFPGLALIISEYLFDEKEKEKLNVWTVEERESKVTFEKEYPKILSQLSFFTYQDVLKLEHLKKRAEQNDISYIKALKTIPFNQKLRSS